MTERPRFFGMVSTRHSLHYTPVAVRSFFECTRLNPKDRFYLIDNDQSCDPKTIKHFGHVDFVSNTVPLSFAENVNQTARIALENKGDLYFLNNDLAFSPNWLEPLLVSDPGILSPYSNQEIQYDHPEFKIKPYLSLAEYLPHELVFRQIAEVHRARCSGFRPVLLLPFFCVKLPLEVLTKVGLLDCRFGVGGGEDYDYCLRAALAGFSIRFAEASYILHFGGRSTWAGSEDQLQKKAHDAEIFKAFEDKWGTELLRLAFFDDLSLIQQTPALQSLLESKDYPRLISSLQRRPCGAG